MYIYKIDSLLAYIQYQWLNITIMETFLDMNIFMNTSAYGSPHYEEANKEGNLDTIPPVIKEQKITQQHIYITRDKKIIKSCKIINGIVMAPTIKKYRVKDLLNNK